ncbi:MAG: hypothetical protein JNK73_02610 [Bacteroidia bacterium]|nr:hypothetical protein [Bacteroidia bacterium]
MKNTLLLIACTLLFSVFNNIYSQATGNDIYNSNNRFLQNSVYRGSADKRYKSAQPQVSTENNIHFQSTALSGNSLTAWNTNNNEMVVNVNILYNAKPSAFMAIFHVNQAAEKISELDTLMNRRVEKFIALAKNIGLKRDNFYLDMIALVPIYSKEKRVFSKTYTQVPKGFEMQKNIHVKYQDPNQLDRLFAMAAQCEIYDLIKVEYLFDSAELAGQTMRNKALQCLNAKLAGYKKIGISLDTSFKQLTESGNIYFPIDRYQAYKPLAISSVEEMDKPDDAGTLMKTGAGMVTRTTVFYNQANIEGFDAVFNPSPLQPPIQFVYNLTVRYRYNQAKEVITVTKTEKTTELLIVTPQGEIKEIKK